MVQGVLLNYRERLPRSLFVPQADILKSLQFRLASDEDLMAVHNSFYAGQPFTQFRAHYLRVMDRQQKGRSYWLVVKLKTRFIGTGQLVIYAHGAELANIVVSAENRNQGVGSAIIHVLTAIARHVGLTTIEIGVNADNERALALYRRLGFVEDRQMRVTDGDPAIILRKAL